MRDLYLLLGLYSAYQGYRLLQIYEQRYGLLMPSETPGGFQWYHYIYAQAMVMFGFGVVIVALHLNISRRIYFNDLQ